MNEKIEGGHTFRTVRVSSLLTERDKISGGIKQLIVLLLRDGCWKYICLAVEIRDYLLARNIIFSLKKAFNVIKARGKLDDIILEECKWLALEAIKRFERLKLLREKPPVGMTINSKILSGINRLTT